MSQNAKKNNIEQSVFQKNYNQLSTSKKEILNEKYNCSICLELIKHENPFLCYKCQKIFHHSCLKSWDTSQKQLKKKLSCPNCRNELPFKDWKVLINYDENRTKEALILNQIGKSFDSNEFTNQSIALYKNIINKLNHIHSVIESNPNNKLNILLEEFKSNLIHPSINEISSVIIDELDLIEKNLINSKKSIINKEEVKYKDKINLKYLTEKQGPHWIFGSDFVYRYKSEISLIINGEDRDLVDLCNLKKGMNDITLCIGNKVELDDLSYMFFKSKSLYDIEELKYLNTSKSKKFSHMFETCQITNINALETWDVSKSESFNSMFANCESIVNLSPLKNWDVSECEDFSCMFYNCLNLININALENWNVSSGNNFSHMFRFCKKLNDINPLKNWDLSNALNLSCFFMQCTQLSSIDALQNWNLSNCQDISWLFYLCENLSNINPIKNWNVSNVTDFSHVFSECKLLTDITAIQNWKVSKGKNFAGMFSGCQNIFNIEALKNWNVSNGTNFSGMFSWCSHLNDISPLENWDVSNGEDFSTMFQLIYNLNDVAPLKNWNVSKGKKFDRMFRDCPVNRNILKGWKFGDNNYFNTMFD